MIKTIFLFIVVLLSSCITSDERNCNKTTHHCYIPIDFNSISDDDAFVGSFRYSNDSIIFLYEGYKKKEIYLEFLFFNFSMHESDTMQVTTPKCYGDKCNDLYDLFWGNGYIIVVTHVKGNKYLFKHIMLNKFTPPDLYIEPKSFYRNKLEKIALTEKHYEVEKLKKGFRFTRYKEVKGVLNERYFY
ncbi:MAG: hypothetical protein JNK77_07085 [Saprospiraceae bacterium]|nr:hypothetical protein [Saprospiraceae bacterium]